jgi:pilus assembly protein CpaE
MITVMMKMIEPELERYIRKIIGTLDDFKAIDASSPNRADILIYQLGETPEMDFTVIEASMTAASARHLFLVSGNLSSDVLLKAIQTGAKGFFSTPLDKNELLTALAKARDEIGSQAQTAPSKSEGRIINVVGSKGGVGTTTIAVNVASSLSGKGFNKKVALLDMNTLFGDIPLFLSIQSKFHWGEITKNIERLDATFLTNVLDKHPTGINVLSSPGYLNGHVAPTPATIDQLLTLMKQMYDYIVIDSGQSTSDTSLKILQMAETVLLVSTLSLPCLSNTNKLLQSFQNLGYASRDKMKVVINRYLKKGDIGLKDAESGINQKLFWVLPNDYSSTMSAINQGKPLSDISPKASITRSIQELSKALVGLSMPDKKPLQKKRGLFGRLRN